METPVSNGNKSDGPTVEIESLVVGLGAQIERVGDDGVVDFDLEGIHGLAYLNGEGFRASYFIALDPDKQEAADWVRDHVDVPYGEVQFIDVPDGTAIRLLVEEPLDARRNIFATGSTARALAFGWETRGRGTAEMSPTLGDAGIVRPPLGATVESAIYAFGAWSWGSHYIPPFLMYMFEVDYVARILIQQGPFVALSHAGRGFNSYGLNLVTAVGSVAAFVQHGYGGVYMDPVSSLIDINATYSRLHVLFRAGEEEADSELRWLLLYSEFRGVCGVLDLDKVRQGASREDAFEMFDGESELFRAAARRFAGYDFFPGGGEAAW